MIKNQFLKSLKLGKRDLAIFGINAVLMFVMVVFQHMHFETPRFFKSFQEMVSPLPAKLDIFDKVLPKLQQTGNSYKLNKPTSFIPEAEAGSDFENATAYIVVDFETGNVLESKNIDKPLPIASLTKIMSAVVALDLAKHEDIFTAQYDVTNIIPTKINVQPGEKLSLEELLNAALLTSANDSVEVIKDGINEKYGADVFVRAMNEKAKFLGLDHTHFTNPQGFDDGNPYSSVEDLAILSHYALENYPLIDDLVRKQFASLPETSTHQAYDKLYNWNGLLGVYPGVYGIKIGNTDDAGKTTAVISERLGKKVLVIVLGAPGILERDLWASELLDSGFVKAANLPPVDVTRAQLLEKYHTWI